jgi:hypothetical protein
LQYFVRKHILLWVVIGERLHVPELSVDLSRGGTLFDSPAGLFFTSKLKALLMAHSDLRIGRLENRTSSGFATNRRSVDQQGMAFPRVKDLQHNGTVLSTCFCGKIPHFLSFT